MTQPEIAPQETLPANPRDRRRNERVRLAVEVRWGGLSGRHTARLYDISLSGCYIESPGLTQSGECIPFEVQSPTGRWLQLQGEVVHSQTHMGFGVRFFELSELQRRGLALLIAYAHAVSDSSGQKPSYLAA
jgi:c-di-GMP-binding flagellar brake protein YcgR